MQGLRQEGEARAGVETGKGKKISMISGETLTSLVSGLPATFLIFDGSWPISHSKYKHKVSLYVRLPAKRKSRLEERFRFRQIHYKIIRHESYIY